MLDCRSLEYTQVPLPEGVTLVVCDTTVRRALASSEYNARREQCMRGVEGLAGKIPGIRSLRDVSPEQLSMFGGTLDPQVHRRCRHVVTEIRRVECAADALRHGDLSEFGKLMYDSHLSLRVDYEVTCRELDVLVDICAESEGVYGARMTGAGFGGCVICLAKDDAVPALVARLESEYPRMSGKSPAIYVCATDDGASVRAV